MIKILFYIFLFILIIMKQFIVTLILIFSLNNIYGKEWIIKLSIKDIKVFSSDTLRHPSWFITKYKLKNAINLSFFTHKTFVPPYKDFFTFNPNNTFGWPFVSIDYPHHMGVPNINPHLHFTNGDGIPAIWSKYIFAGTPLLVKDSLPQSIPHNKFTLATRPRTVFGSHHPDSVMIYISSGIKIVDIPKRLLELGCQNAINMDGGGSTFLYKEKEYVYVQTSIKKMRKYPNILSW